MFITQLHHYLTNHHYANIHMNGWIFVSGNAVAHLWQATQRLWEQVMTGLIVLLWLLLIIEVRFLFFHSRCKQQPPPLVILLIPLPTTDWWFEVELEERICYYNPMISFFIRTNFERIVEHLQALTLHQSRDWENREPVASQLYLAYWQSWRTKSRADKVSRPHNWQKKVPIKIRSGERLWNNDLSEVLMFAGSQTFRQL